MAIKQTEDEEEDEPACLACVNAVQLGGKMKPGDSNDIWICAVLSTLRQIVQIDERARPFKDGKQICPMWEFYDEEEEGEEEVIEDEPAAPAAPEKNFDDLDVEDVADTEDAIDLIKEPEKKK